MTTINLLPWREQLREEQKKQFLTIFGIALVVSVLIVVGMHMTMSNSISHQKARNKMIEQEIALLNRKIAEIKNLKKEKESLIARMNIIQELQTSRPLSVHLFDSLVKIIPDGVHVSDIQRENYTVTMIGAAESNSQVSNLMRNISASDWLKKPNLSQIKTVKDDKKANEPAYKEFTLKFFIRKPKSEESEGEGEDDVA